MAKKSATSQIPTKFAELSEAAYAYVEKAQNAAIKKFDLTTQERWDYDQDKCTLIFSNKGKPAVIARIQVAGSFSQNTDTWLWSWANDSTLEKARAEVLKVAEFGKKHKIKPLSTPHITCTEADAWELAVISCYLLKAQAIYRVPSDHLSIFLILFDLDSAVI